MTPGQIITFSLICDKCTRTQAFHGASQHDCKVRAMRAGWVQDKCTACHGTGKHWLAMQDRYEDTPCRTCGGVATVKDVCPTCPARRVRLCTFDGEKFPVRKMQAYHPFFEGNLLTRYSILSEDHMHSFNVDGGKDVTEGEAIEALFGQLAKQGLRPSRDAMELPANVQAETLMVERPCPNEQYYPQRQQRRGWESDSWCKEHLDGNRPEWKDYQPRIKVTGGQSFEPAPLERVAIPIVIYEGAD